MTMVYSYYEAGRMIVEKSNREVNVLIMVNIFKRAVRLAKEFGRGFSYDNLKLMRKFYLVNFPKTPPFMMTFIKEGGLIGYLKKYETMDVSQL